MTAIVPSFIAKLDRAEKHLVELKAAIDCYGGTDAQSRPYTVRTSVEGKRKRQVHRLHFTRSISNTEVPLITADAIYNLRSSLEHLMASLVSAKDRRSVTFPIFFRGVHNDPVAGENEQRLKDRQRWSTISRAVHVDALAFLKRLQPPDEARNQETPHALRLLNQLSNIDRHTKLPLFASGVNELVAKWRLPNGDIVDTLAAPEPTHMLEDHAELRNVPQGAVYVEGYGAPEIVIRTGMTDEHGKVNLPIVDFISDTLGFLRSSVVPGLVPYVRAPGKRK